MPMLNQFRIKENNPEVIVIFIIINSYSANFITKKSNAFTSVVDVFCYLVDVQLILF